MSTTSRYLEFFLFKKFKDFVNVFYIFSLEMPTQFGFFERSVSKDF